MLKNKINPEILLNLKACKQSFALSLLNLKIWYAKVKQNDINKNEKIFKPIMFLNKYINIKQVNKYDDPTNSFIFFLNLIDVDLTPIISSSFISWTP